MTDTVITIPKPTKPHSDIARETGVALGGTQPGRVIRTSSRLSAAAAVIEIDKLYPATEGSDAYVTTALGLLAEAIDKLQAARIAAQDKDIVTADRHVQRFQARLPELFRLRKIGDGYAVIVNSLHFALINQHGRPLTSEQITTIWRVLKELRNAPFVPFEQALDRVVELEECGLRVDPPIITELVPESDDE